MAEEEETTASAWGFTSFEDHVPIVLWTKTGVQNLVWSKLFLECVHEHPHFVECHLDCLLQRYHVCFHWILVWSSVSHYIEINHVLLGKVISGLFFKGFLLPLTKFLDLDLLQLQSHVFFFGITENCHRLLGKRDSLVRLYILELCDALENYIDQLNVQRRR